MTDEPLTGEGISLAGYGYPGGIPGANPPKTILDNYTDWFSSNWDSSYLNPVRFEWMCYAHAPSSTFMSWSCSSAFSQGLGSCNVTVQDWPSETAVHIPNTGEDWVSMDSILHSNKASLQNTLLESKLTWTRKYVKAFLSFMQTNPVPQQVWGISESDLLDCIGWARCKCFSVLSGRTQRKYSSLQ